MLKGKRIWQYWNAVVGKSKVNNVTETFRLGRRNEKGERFLEFCAKYKMWKMPGDINKYQIDYIMVKNKFKNKIK